MNTHGKIFFPRQSERAKSRSVSSPGSSLVARGFTLIEMIVVIVLVGIVAIMVAVFIRRPVNGYIDSVARADIADTGDTVVRRVARDVRLALPNSLRASADANGNGQYLELLLTRTGGRYLSADDSSTSGAILDFTNTNALTFDVVGPVPTTGPQAIQAGSDSVVVYNLGTGIAPADAYANPATNRALINSISRNGTTNVTTITMAANPFAAQSPVMPSPYHRFQVISGPVTYYWNASAQTLTRYWGYTIGETQPNSTSSGSLSGAQNALIATGVTCAANNCFTYSNSNAISNALLEINLTLTAPSTDNGNGGSVTLFQQVHVDNTP